MVFVRRPLGCDIVDDQEDQGDQDGVDDVEACKGVDFS